MAVGSAMIYQMPGYPVMHPGIPASSDLAVSLLAGGGVLLWCVGIFRLVLGHYLASIFQMIYSLEPAKAKKWTRKLTDLSVLTGYGAGTGAAICFGGPYFGEDQKNTDTALTTGFVIFSAFLCIAAGAMTYGLLEIRALQNAIRADSSTAKALKNLVTLFTLMTAFFAFLPLSCITMAAVPWLLARAGTIFYLANVPLFPFVAGLAVYELHQLHKRQAAQKQQCRITPTSTNGRTTSERTNTITATVAATKQALLSNEQQRRDPDASLVLGSGVSLAFLELFVRENGVDATMTANDVVNAHVKPHTKDIGRGGSGAFVELISDGKDDSGQWWCATPTHMLSYSWSYSVAMIVDALRTFEREHPPSKGERNYYFVDQFALNQHEFAKDLHAEAERGHDAQ
jgi:hypothetical protein